MELQKLSKHFSLGHGAGYINYLTVLEMYLGLSLSSTKCTSLVSVLIYAKSANDRSKLKILIERERTVKNHYRHFGTRADEKS